MTIRGGASHCAIEFGRWFPGLSVRQHAFKPAVIVGVDEMPVAVTAERSFPCEPGQEVVMPSHRPTERLAHFFSGVAEQTFQAELGVVDPPLVDYLSELLLRFVRQDLAVPRGVTGHRLSDLGEMLQEATFRLGEAQRKIHCQIGDFALFWAGLFPEALRTRSQGGDDQFHQYCAQGSRAYLVASQIESLEQEAPSADLLQRLAERFELCAYGLREVRREWERLDEDENGSGTILLN